MLITSFAVISERPGEQSVSPPIPDRLHKTARTISTDLISSSTKIAITMSPVPVFPSAFKGDLVTPESADYEAAIARWADGSVRLRRTSHVID